MVGTFSVGLPVHLQGKPDEPSRRHGCEALDVVRRRQVATPFPRRSRRRLTGDGPDLRPVHVDGVEIKSPAERSSVPVVIVERPVTERLIEETTEQSTASSQVSFKRHRCRAALSAMPRQAYCLERKKPADRPHG